VLEAGGRDRTERGSVIGFGRRDHESSSTTLTSETSSSTLSIAERRALAQESDRDRAYDRRRAAGLPITRAEVISFCLINQFEFDKMNAVLHRRLEDLARGGKRRPQMPTRANAGFTVTRGVV
jgi:hypothetical protein